MRHLATGILLAFLACLLASACGPSPGRDEGAQAAAARPGAARDEALRAIRELESAVDEARRFVEAAGTPAETAEAKARRLVSETRRAIVVANVSLQKARTALAGGDAQAALAAMAGAVERLNAIREGKAVPGQPTGAR